MKSMKFKVSIMEHRRLHPFLKRQEILKKEKRNKWKLGEATLNKPRGKLLSVDGSVDILYLELLKHIAIGGDLYTSREIEGDLEGIIKLKNGRDNEMSFSTSKEYNEKYQKAYKEAISEQFLKDWIDQIKGSYLKIKNNLGGKNFKKMRDETKTGRLSYDIGQGIATYLASEIDNVFFTLPYDYVREMLNLPTGGRKPDLVGFIWDYQEYTPFCIVLEAKGRSNENITPNQIKEWKKQKNANRGGLETEYGIVSATYNLYDEDESPKCLYIDPEGNSGYKLEQKDYVKLLNLYYAPFRSLLSYLKEKGVTIGTNIIEKEVYYVISLKDLYRDKMVNEKISLYLRKQFMDVDDWENRRSFMSKGTKIQKDNLYIDNDGIGFGLRTKPRLPSTSPCNSLHAPYTPIKETPKSQKNERIANAIIKILKKLSKPIKNPLK